MFQDLLRHYLTTLMEPYCPFVSLNWLPLVKQNILHRTLRSKRAINQSSSSSPSKPVNHKRSCSLSTPVTVIRFPLRITSTRSLLLKIPLNTTIPNPYKPTHHHHQIQPLTNSPIIQWNPGYSSPRPHLTSIVSSNHFLFRFHFPSPRQLCKIVVTPSTQLTNGWWSKRGKVKGLTVRNWKEIKRHSLDLQIVPFVFRKFIRSIIHSRTTYRSR